MRIGIDLGGTKIEGIALDANGEVLFRSRIATPAGQYRPTLEAVAHLVAQLEAATGSRGAKVGVGTPGAASQATGLMKNCNSTCLNGMPLLADLEALLGPRVRIANDANCFALSEASDGAAAGAHCVFGVILGTGVGAGIVIGGRILKGANGIAGEWGHNPLSAPTPDELPGPPCYCGRSGCVETWCSGPGFAADARRHGVPAADAAEVMARCRGGEPAAMAAFERYLDRLARSLASVVNVVDPDVVVLGGGLSNVGELYEQLPARLAPHVFSDTVATRIVPPRHGDASGVRGAAWLWPA
ncbi:MAG TPA: ROK family protein [Ramlibacter sp.]|nr:ROK family protein [Ramlibacter sp.]